MYNSNFLYRLKYLYLIPIDKLTQELQSLNPVKENNSPTSIDIEPLTALLDNIYNIIFKYSAPYSNCINPTMTTETFFGEGSFPTNSTALSSYYMGAANLIKFSIFHHCVIHSFYNSLSNYPESNFPNNNEHLFLKTYDMVAKNDYFFTNSVSSIISSPAPSELQRKDDAAQYRAKYAQRYRTFINFPDEYYSKYLLQTVLHELPKEAGNQKQNSHFNVPLILNIWSDFLYSDRSVHHFDRALAKNTSLLNIYGTLSSEYEDLVESCHANIDKLFVSYPLENTYGFHTLAGIAKLLSNFETQNTLNTKDYSDLTTDSFFKTLNLLFKNPLVYNRLFLIRYACDAIMNGAFAEPGYLKTKASTVIAQNTSRILSDSARINNGLTLLEQYLNTLTNLIIPLITDLWDYACAVLKLDTTYFQPYLEYYYPIITGNWCALSAEEIGSWHLSSTQDLRSELANVDFYPVPKTSKHLSDFYPILEKGNTYFKKSLPTSTRYKAKLDSLLHNYPKSVKELISTTSNFIPTNYYPPDLCTLFNNCPVDGSVFGHKDIEIAILNLKKDHARLLNDLSLIKS